MWVLSPNLLESHNIRYIGQMSFETEGSRIQASPIRVLYSIRTADHCNYSRWTVETMIRMVIVIVTTVKGQADAKRLIQLWADEAIQTSWRDWTTIFLSTFFVTTKINAKYCAHVFKCQNASVWIYVQCGHRFLKLKYATWITSHMST
jgi:hypothetical protein